MDWQELLKHFEKTHEFFWKTNISPVNSNQQVAIHPLIKFSTGLATSTLTNLNECRLVLLFPDRLECAQWISALSSLEIIKTNYKQNFEQQMEFQAGEKLQVNGCVVEFIEQYIAKPHNHPMMRVKCRDGEPLGLDLNKKLDFQKIQTEKPLDTRRKVEKAYNAAKMIDSPLDEVLNIKTRGNRSFVQKNLLLISKQGKSKKFIENLKINGREMLDLFLWAKLDRDGNVKILNQTEKELTAVPSCVLSQDMARASLYLQENQDRTQCVVIDGVEDCIDNLDILQDMLDQKLPVIVIADVNDRANPDFHHLEENDFKIWHWNRELVKPSLQVQSTPLSPFALLNRTLEIYSNREIEPDICQDATLDQLVFETVKLEIPQDDDKLQSMYRTLAQQINELVRMIYIPDEQWQQQYAQIMAGLDFSSLWISNETEAKINSIITEALRLSKKQSNKENAKIAQLNEILRARKLDERIVVIVPSKDEAEQCQHYWQAKISLSDLRFMSDRDFFKSSSQTPPHLVVVCGWLNRERIMRRLLHSYLVEEIRLLMYPSEKVWFDSAMIQWERQNNYPMKGEDFSAILGIAEKELQFINRPQTRTAIHYQKNSTDDLPTLEDKITRYRYANYSAEESAEARQVRAVHFTEGRLMFMTETHAVTIVSGLQEADEEDINIVKKIPQELFVGDFFLYRESDRDLIIETADSILEKSDQLREIASRWQKGLQRKYKEWNCDFNRLVGALRKVGCARDSNTIRGWLMNPKLIGPQKHDDLKAIIEICGDPNLSTQLREIQSAIDEVKRSHRKAGRYLAKKIFEALCNNSIAFDRIDMEDDLTLDMEELGAVQILKIQEINDNLSVSKSDVNRMLQDK